MNRFFLSALALLLVSGTAACAAETEDTDAPAVDVDLAPNATAGFSTGETTGGDSLEKSAEGGTKQQEYLKIELKDLIVSSY